jgi:hypothetical protein
MPNAVQSLARSPKRRLTLQEACSEFEKSRKMQNTRSRQRFQDGWVDVDPNNCSWTVKNINTPTAGARLAKIKRTASISDVFFAVLPPSVLVDVRKELGAENLRYNGTSKVPLADIYKMYAVCIHLRASRPHVDKGMFTSQQPNNLVIRGVWALTSCFFCAKRSRFHLQWLEGSSPKLFVRWCTLATLCA